MSLGQIIQLAALGVQNLYLNIKPQYTMFRKSYKRHTNYATQVVKVSANGTVGWGAKVDFDLTRNGDLVAETYLVVQLPCITGGIYKEEKWWPTAYKAVPGYVNPDKDHWSHRGDALSAHVGKRHQEDASTKRVQAVLGHVAAKGRHWAGHPKCDSANAQTNGTTKDTGTLVGPSHSQVAYVDSLGHAIIKDARFFVAQNVIQEFTGEYMHIHHLMNNPAESLNEALFSYGDDMHAQGPQGGSLADGVGFQASKFGHGAIATGGFWVDMGSTKTDPRQAMGSLYDNASGAYRPKKGNTSDRPNEDARKGKADFQALDDAATSKIGRAMAFLPLASQTYVGMCFHNSSAANAHIDFADKMMDTRSAESPYVAGTLIGTDETSKQFVAIKGTTGNYSNFDDWAGNLAKSIPSDASDDFKAALTVGNYFSSASAEKHYTAIRDAFSSQSSSQIEGAFFLVPRGIRSRSQPRGLGLHDHAGYHGSLVRVEDSVGSGTFVSDKFIGLDEFNAMSSVPRVLASSTVTELTEGEVRAALDLGIGRIGTTSELYSPFDMSKQDTELLFGEPASTRHHNAFTFTDFSHGAFKHAVKLWYDASESNKQFAPNKGDAIFMKQTSKEDVHGPGINYNIDTFKDSARQQVPVLCIKFANVKGSASLATDVSTQGRFAVALCLPNLVAEPGKSTEFYAAYELLKRNKRVLRNGQVVKIQLISITNKAMGNDTGNRRGNVHKLTNWAEGANKKPQIIVNDQTPAEPDKPTMFGARSEDIAGTTNANIFARLNDLANASTTAQDVDLYDLGFSNNTTGAKAEHSTITNGHQGDLFRVFDLDYNDNDSSVFLSFVHEGAGNQRDATQFTTAVQSMAFTRPMLKSGLTYAAAGAITATSRIMLVDYTMSKDSLYGTSNSKTAYDATKTNANGAGTQDPDRNSEGLGLALDLLPTLEAESRFDASFGIYRNPTDTRIFLGYAGDMPSSYSTQSWPTAANLGYWGTNGTDPVVRAKKTAKYKMLPLYSTREGALNGTAADLVDLSHQQPPMSHFNPYWTDITTETGGSALFVEPMTGLDLAEQKAVSSAVIKKCEKTLSAMVDDMIRSEFHRGAKQSGSQYFDSESTAGCGPRASLGALMYTAACAQPLGSAPACSQLASDILVPQYSDAIVAAESSKLTYGTRIMAALDRSSALGKIAGVRGTGYVESLFDHQDVETARLVKNYNPGPAYEVVSSRLDSSLYSKLRTHAQMNTGFGRRAQLSAVGNHQMEDGSGKCVQVVVPMPWWYAEGPACDGRRTQALPMIALQYHNVSISVNLRRLDECVQTDREHRQQPFRCSKMIGSLGASALKDAASADCAASAGSSLTSFAAMPSASHGAREGATMIDTLGSHNGNYPQERAVTCVNMHSVKDTLTGMRYTTADDIKVASSLGDVTSGRSGGHLIAANDASTAPGYQGHVDERHHVDVGAWLNFSGKADNYLNSAAEAVPRNTMRIGVTDGEFYKSTGPFSSKKSDVGGLTSATATSYAGGSEGGDVADWGQGTWDAKMSTASTEVIGKLSKVPMAAVFGSAQTNGGFAMHSEAQALANKMCLAGGATICAMADAIQGNADVCSVFNKVSGTMGWKTAGSVTGSKSDLQIIGAHLLITYIFLDSSERRLFAANAHEYLLTQVQTQEHHEGRFAQSGTTKQITMDLKFNHPVSHLFWVLQRPESQWAREWFRYEATHGGGDPLMIRAELSLNASKREEENYLNAMNTTVIEPWNYFKKCNNTGIGGALKSHSHDGSAKNIHLYSFAQNPGEWYPTGSLNFSRIDRVELKLYCKAHAESHLTHPLVWGGGGYRELNTELTNAAQSNTVAGIDDKIAERAAYGEIAQGIMVRVYARNFNVFRIQSGMGALKYAN